MYARYCGHDKLKPLGDLRGSRILVTTTPYVNEELSCCYAIELYLPNYLPSGCGGRFTQAPHSPIKMCLCLALASVYGGKH